MNLTTRRLLAGALAVLVCAAVGRAAEPDAKGEVPEKYKPVVEKGLAWLAQEQHKDGHWEATNGAFPTAMTALAGLAFLAEGSTAEKGQYSANVRKATEWLLANLQKNGYLGDPKNQADAGRYMMGQGYGVLFLTQVYAKESDEKRRKELAEALAKAIDFIVKAQTKRGGWGYVAAADGGDFDEGCATAIQVHALFAARAAKLDVPKKVIDGAKDYLKDSTKVVKKDQDDAKTEAGVIYSLSAGPNWGARPALTAAAAAALLHAGGDKSELTVQWLNYLQKVLPVAKGQANRFGHDEFTHYYLAQAYYRLGEDRHAKLRPDLADAEKNEKETNALMTWSRYRAVTFANLAAAQDKDGSWKDSTVGPVYATAINLAILQLDKNQVPFYKR